MTDRRLRIVQVSQSDGDGGANMVAFNLLRGFRARGHSAWMLVGKQVTQHPEVLQLAPNGRGPRWTAMWRRLAGAVRRHGGPNWFGVGDLFDDVAAPTQRLKWRLGYEDFDFPATRRLLQRSPERPDIVQCHNLHGGYFDLRVLPRLSHQIPMVMTLHDAWLLSGHCAHSLDCERWEFGCGRCPYLTTYPAVQRDATGHNWRQKQHIYDRSRLYVATPSRWLLEKVERSMLAPAVVEGRVIPNGVDRAVFRPGDRAAKRAVLGIPEDAVVILFTAWHPRVNEYKDFATVRDAVQAVATANPGRRVFFLVVGDDAPAERTGCLEVRYMPFRRDPRLVASYFQLADLYVHAARADTFPGAVLEALACGTPVIATAVGGIPEQVRGVAVDGAGDWLASARASQGTGVLVPPADPRQMSGAIEHLLRNPALMRTLSENAVRDVRERFGLGNQVKAYLAWYDEILTRRASDSD